MGQKVSDNDRLATNTSLVEWSVASVVTGVDVYELGAEAVEGNLLETQHYFLVFSSLFIYLFVYFPIFF